MMTTIAEKLTLLNNTKTAIAAAIEAKGVIVGSAPFADYPNKIADITSGGTSTDEWTQEYYNSVYAAGPGSYQRPLDWPALPTLAKGDQRCVGLHAVYENDGNFCALSVAGAYTIDWGDGVSENYASGVTAYHKYDFTNINLSAITSCGYKCAVVSITPQSGQSLTSINLHKKHNQSNLTVYSSGFLDIAIAGQSISSLLIGAISNGTTSNSILFSRLEQFRFVGSNLITNFGTIFYKCYFLESIIELDTSTGISFTGIFQSCYSLKTIPFINTSNAQGLINSFAECLSLLTIPFIDTAKVLYFSGTFSSCPSLRVIPLLSTSLGSSMGSFFRGCVSLKNMPLIDTSNNTTFYYMFSDCKSLKEIPSLNTEKGTSFEAMFSGCDSLSSIPLLNTSLSTSFVNMFSGCKSLSSIPAINTAKGTNFSTMFNTCSSLKTIPLLDTALGTNFSSMFNTCSSLKTIPLLDTALGTNFSNMFFMCLSLESIPNINTANGTLFGGMFSTCSSLQNIPALNMSNSTSSSSYTNIFSSCSNLANIDAYGFKYSFSVTSCKLSATALNKLYNNVATTTGQTLTVTSNWGISLDDPTIATAKGWTVTG